MYIKLCTDLDLKEKDQAEKADAEEEEEEEAGRMRTLAHSVVKNEENVKAERKAYCSKLECQNVA